VPSESGRMLGPASMASNLGACIGSIFAAGLPTRVEVINGFSGRLSSWRTFPTQSRRSAARNCKERCW